MGKINSKTKGKVGEREFAKLLKKYGFKDARRGQQYNGLDGEDVVGLPEHHIEVKRVEKLNIYNAINQSINDAKDNEIPIVAHRKNREKWLITLLAEDYLKKIKRGIVK